MFEKGRINSDIHHHKSTDIDIDSNAYSFHNLAAVKLSQVISSSLAVWYNNCYINWLILQVKGIPPKGILSNYQYLSRASGGSNADSSPKPAHSIFQNEIVVQLNAAK